MAERVVETRCTHCEHTFELSHRLAGSLQNCPSCQRATQIEGDYDPVWKFASLGARLAVLVVFSVILSLNGFGPAMVALGIGLGLLLLVRLCL